MFSWRMLMVCILGVSSAVAMDNRPYLYSVQNIFFKEGTVKKRLPSLYYVASSDTLESAIKKDGFEVVNLTIDEDNSSINLNPLQEYTAKVEITKESYEAIKKERGQKNEDDKALLEKGLQFLGFSDEPFSTSFYGTESMNGFIIHRLNKTMGVKGSRIVGINGSQERKIYDKMLRFLNKKPEELKESMWPFQSILRDALFILYQSNKQFFDKKLPSVKEHFDRRDSTKQRFPSSQLAKEQDSSDSESSSDDESDNDAQDTNTSRSNSDTSNELPPVQPPASNCFITFDQLQSLLLAGTVVSFGLTCWAAYRYFIAQQKPESLPEEQHQTR